MNEKINCPFCGNEVEKNDIKCNHCESFFADPDLADIKFKEFGSFVALLVLTFGLFGIFWILINVSAINKLADNTKDKIKLNSLITISVLDIAAYIICLTECQTVNYIIPLLTVFQCLIFIAMTHRILRIIQKYTLKSYNITLEYNPYYIVFFNILYLVHFIDTYTNRVLQTHEYFNAKSPQMIMLIIILLIIQFVMCWNTNVHNFYRWFFGL